MKISAINTNIQHRNYKNNFKGITTAIPISKLDKRDDLLQYIGCLSQAKYYEALDDNIYPSNKTIRRQNFSLLDANFSTEFKKAFIELYKNMTGFPNLKKTSSMIVKEFMVKSETGARKFDSKIEGLGFDCTSSIGLQKALPGSDIDKAYVILKDNGNPYLVDSFKAYLWENVNQFLMSLNHRDTFPEVFTTKKIESTLEKVDKVIVDNMDSYSHKVNDANTGLTVAVFPYYVSEFEDELTARASALKKAIEYCKYINEKVSNGQPY